MIRGNHTGIQGHPEREATPAIRVDRCNTIGTVDVEQGSMTAVWNVASLNIKVLGCERRTTWFAPLEKDDLNLTKKLDEG